MNCLDCSLTDVAPRPVIGVCRDCGAATCLDHSVISKPPRPPVGLMPGTQPARTLRCATCQHGRR